MYVKKNMKSRRKAYLMIDVYKRESERDRVSKSWKKIDNSEYNYNIKVYMLEVPVKDHKRVEVVEVENQLK